MGTRESPLFLGLQRGERRAPGLADGTQVLPRLLGGEGVHAVQVEEHAAEFPVHRLQQQKIGLAGREFEVVLLGDGLHRPSAALYPIGRIVVAHGHRTLGGPDLGKIFQRDVDMIKKKKKNKKKNNKNKKKKLFAIHFLGERIIGKTYGPLGAG